jgi:trans-aconitate methyltransferase
VSPAALGGSARLYDRAVGRPLQPIAERLPRPAVNRVKHWLGYPLSSNLNALAMLWGTDKGPSLHDYTPHYAAHLRARRWRVRHVLEIGVGGTQVPTLGGESLRMWRNYFPRAEIYGIDIHPKQLDTTERITVLRADQSDPDSLTEALRGCPEFDLIVDDGSHIGAHQIATFETLFERLAAGGIYAIEDLWTSYLPEFEGGPPGADGTALALTRGLLDDLHLRRREIASLHVYYELLIVVKSRR